MKDKKTENSKTPETTSGSIGPDEAYVEAGDVLADPATGHAVPLIVEETSNDELVRALVMMNQAIAYRDALIVRLEEKVVSLMAEGHPVLIEEELPGRRTYLDRSVADLILERDELKAIVESMPTREYVDSVEASAVATTELNVKLLARNDYLEAQGLALAVQPSLLLFSGYGRHTLRAPAFNRADDFAIEKDGTRWSCSQRGGELVLTRTPHHTANLQVATELRRVEAELGTITRKLAATEKQCKEARETASGLDDRQDRKGEDLIRSAATAVQRYDERKAQLVKDAAPLEAEVKRLKALLADSEKSEVRVKSDLSNVRVVVFSE